MGQLPWHRLIHSFTGKSDTTIQYSRTGKSLKQDCLFGTIVSTSPMLYCEQESSFRRKRSMYHSAHHRLHSHFARLQSKDQQFDNLHRHGSAARLAAETVTEPVLLASSLLEYSEYLVECNSFLTPIRNRLFFDINEQIRSLT
jgi:hypothetical protein